MLLHIRFQAIDLIDDRIDGAIKFHQKSIEEKKALHETVNAFVRSNSIITVVFDTETNSARVLTNER